jgi:hypothetical protein
MRYLAIFAGIFAALYACVAFVSAMPNPMEWPAGGRFLFLFFGLFISAMICTFHHDNRKD